jgi:hypothetical protein
VRTRIYAFRKEREERILLSASVKQFYVYISQRMSPVNFLGPLLDLHSMPITRDSDKDEAFNKFFHSVFTADDGILPVFHPCSDVYMDMPVFNPAEVRGALLEIKNTSSCGSHGCPAKFLRHFPELSIPLSNLFNMSMRQQTVPHAWKLANVVPIYRGEGSKLDITNYRPISLTNVFCKLMEKLVCKRIDTHLKSNALISRHSLALDRAVQPCLSF